MDIYATTPFGRRPVTAGLIERAALRQQAPALPTANKWELFRELCTARKEFGLSDRDLTVLNALLTFHRGDDLSASEQLIVFPSNETLSSRAHGMPESTLRRHIAALVEAGIILRNDSPNGKRYAVKSRTGVLRAYGFDLRPLLVRADEIIEAATKIREEDAQKKELRDTVVILKRDADKLISFGMEDHADDRWTKPREALIELGKMLRRKLDISTLTSLKMRLHALVENLHHLLGMTVGKTPEMSGTDSQNERHHSNSNNNSIESEQSTVPLPMVLTACPDVADFANRPLRSWHDFISAMSVIKAMMGISTETWDHAMKIMGPKNTSVVCAGILQRMGEIKSPGGYLRRLTQKAEEGGFSPMPMMIALSRRQS